MFDVLYANRYVPQIRIFRKNTVNLSLIMVNSFKTNIVVLSR